MGRRGDAANQQVSGRVGSRRCHGTHGIYKPSANISHIGRLDPIRYRPPALEDHPARGNAPLAHSPFRSYGVAEGVATGEFCAAGVAVGFASSFRAALGEETGVADTCGVTPAAGVPAALAVGLGKLVVGLGIALAFGATVALGAGFVFFSSFSRRPVLRSELCRAVKIVRRRVTPKNIPPR